MRWLKTFDENGHQHVLRNDEWHLHRRSSNRTTSCVCNPRIRDGVVVHRTLLRVALYTPLKDGGH